MLAIEVLEVNEFWWIDGWNSEDEKSKAQRNQPYASLEYEFREWVKLAFNYLQGAADFIADISI